MDTILLTGKTRLFSKEALENLSRTYQVFATDKTRGEDRSELAENIRVFSATPLEGDFRKIFEVSRIRTVWHVSSCADGGKASDETAGLEVILRLCSEFGVPRLIILTESRDSTDYRQLIRRWSADGGNGKGVDIAVVFLPLLSGTDTPGSRISTIFAEMRKKRVIVLEGRGSTPVCVLPVRELCAVLSRMTSETWFRPGVYTASDENGTLENFREVLLSVRPDARIEFLAEKSADADSRGAAIFRLPVPDSKKCDGRLSDMYRLPASMDWGMDLAAQYTRLLDRSSASAPLREKLSGCLPRVGMFAGAVLDIAVMFVLAEFLAGITSDSVYFKVVDVRLLYVILMGMMHGLAAGTIASALECIMLLVRYSEIGISGLLIFYNVENWIPFVFYLTAGVISGYTHQKYHQKVRSVQAENELIRNKYLFLNEAYQTCVKDKKELRAQILSEEQSYGRIYEAVRRMSQRTPEAVFVEAVKVFRQVLDNGTVSMYQIDMRGRNADLMSFCRENAVRHEISLARFPEMMEVVEKGGTWKNIEFLEGAPMYASMVRFSRVLQPQGNRVEMKVLVTIEKAEQEQLRTWYVNHFSIMCSLLQDALERASLRERILE